MLKKKLIGLILVACMAFGTCITASAEVTLKPISPDELIVPGLDNFDEDAFKEYMDDLLDVTKSELSDGATILRGDSGSDDSLDIPEEAGTPLGAVLAYFPDLKYTYEDGEYLFSIESEDDLMNFRRLVNGAYWISFSNVELAKECLDINAVLTKDLDFTNYDWESTTYGCWEGIGLYGSSEKLDCLAYSGTFDGNGHTITGLMIDDDSYYYGGLFGYVDGAVIKNVGVVDANIHGYCSMAGLVGYAKNAVIENCFVNGNITAERVRAAGLIGTAVDVKMTNCYFTGNLTCVNSESSTNAVCGLADGANTITKCYYENTYTDLLKGYNASGTYETISKTSDQFKSGEVTYLLNDGVVDGTQLFYQTTGEGLPSFAGKTVYKYTTNETDIYSNYSPEQLAAIQGSVGSEKPSDDKDSPKTGDTYGGNIIAVMMAFVLAGTVGITVRRKRLF